MGRTGGRQKRVRGEFELSLHKSILEKKKNDGSAYSERTVDTLVNTLQKLYRQIFGDKEIMDNLTWLEDAEKVITFINSFKKDEKEYALATKWAFIQAIGVSMKTVGYGSDDENLEPFMKLYNKENELLRLQKDQMTTQGDTSGTTTQTNQVKVLQEQTEQDIFDMVDKMNENSFKDGELVNRKLFMIATIIAIHSEFPFRNDLADVKVIGKKSYEEKVKSGEDKLFNWLILDKKNFSFVLNEFKTKRKYGMIFGDVETPFVKKQLKKWITYGQFGDEVNDTHLFSNEEGRALTRNNISVLLSTETKKYTGGNTISTTLLVKIFNDVPTDYKDITHEDVMKTKKKAHLRGHSTKTRMTHYIKKRS
jgi:hypothetical protein